MKDEPKTWAGLRELIDHGIPAVIVPYDDMPRDIPQWLADSTLRLNAKADACASFFAKHKRWQKSHGDLRIMLFLRSIFAAEAFLSRQIRASPHPESGTACRFLEHFLTSGWYHEWERWSQLHFGVSWNLPFDPWSLN